MGPLHRTSTREPSLFETLYKASPLLIAVSDLSSGRFLECNPAFYTMTRFQPSEVLGHTSAELGLWDDHDHYRRVVTNLPSEGVISGKELKFWTKDHHELWCRCSFTVSDHEGRPALVSMGEDITAEWLLRRADALKGSMLDYLFENTEDPIYAKDAEGRILVCNRAMARTIGKSEVDEVEGRFQREVMNPADLPAVEESDARVLSTGVADESEQVFRHGRRKTVVLSKKGPWYDEQGRVIGLIGISRDITARKHLEEELRRQNELKDRLLTVLAHDLRGPIGSSAQLIGLVAEQVKENPDLSLIFTLLQKQTSQTFNLLENLLAWVQSRLAPPEGPPAPFLVADSLASVRDWLLPQALRKNIDLEVDAAPGLAAQADEKTVQTVLRNLVSNAVKYTPSGGRVVLRAVPADEGLSFEVQDSGIGIPSAKADILFGPGKTASQKGTDGESGHGLGLMFSADLARSLGGRLSFTSSEGQGTTFRLTIPA